MKQPELVACSAFLKFSRGFEAEADYLGIEYMYRSGYDPSAFVSFFEKVQAMEKKKPGTLAKAFDTHPQSADRICEIARRDPEDSAGQAAVCRDDVGVRRSEGEAGGDRKQAQAAGRERLEQAELAADLESGDKIDENDKKDDDDRPTLKRRDDSN